MPDDGEEGKAGGKSGLKRLMPFVAVALVALAAFLLYRTLSRYDYQEIADSIAAIPLSRLGLALVFAAASYLTLTCFDYLALRYVGHPLPYLKAARISFTALSLGHNIGFAALSSGAIRYRFYAQEGLGVEEVAKVILFCGVTVGLGLLTLCGLAVALQPGLAAEITGLGNAPLLGVAAICLAAPVLYVALAATLRRPLRIRRWSMALPSARLALAQVVVGTVNFGFVAACLHQTLSAAADVPYVSVATIYVIATAAALITHVPGGLGVIESVVINLLPQENPIGAVLVFRCVYFLVPLALGGALLAFTEARLRLAASASGKGGVKGAPPLPLPSAKP